MWQKYDHDLATRWLAGRGIVTGKSGILRMGRIIFVGTVHTLDKSSETFLLIKSALSENKDATLIVERAVDTYSLPGSEMKYAEDCAKSLNIPVLCGDISCRDDDIVGMLASCLETLCALHSQGVKKRKALMDLKQAFPGFDFEHHFKRRFGKFLYSKRCLWMSSRNNAIGRYQRNRMRQRDYHMVNCVKNTKGTVVIVYGKYHMYTTYKMLLDIFR